MRRELPPNKSPEPTAVGACQFRYRGSRRRSAVAQLFSLGGIARMAYFFKLRDFEKRFDTMDVEELKRWLVYWTDHAQQFSSQDSQDWDEASS